MDVWTIGHSNHAIGEFIALLRTTGITAVADVRSAPYSRFVPQFNHEALQAALRGAGLAHVYLGAQLGGRPRDPALYRDGKVDYAKLAATEVFQAGLQRVLSGAATHRIALMCAEQHPLDCHRCRLIGRALAEHGATVRHILPEASTITQQGVEEELLRRAKFAASDLFMSRAEQLETAYRTY